jgi:16S rRNA (uracil1498-N3)-methyltransferase
LPSFFVERDGDRAVILGDDARHLARSLRARVGEEIEVVDPAGLMLTLRLDHISPDRVEGVVVAQRAHNPEPAARIVIAIAHLPAPALELVLSRCTEAGAAGFQIIQADRSVARGSKPERWRTICREAAMLAGRLMIPEVEGPISLGEAVALSENPVMLNRAAAGRWSDREMALVPVKASLGPRNLRADTAALVGLATVLARRA